MEQLVIKKSRAFNILSLDGGGSKGVYTIGILKELEKTIAIPLYEHFDLMFGTSTGAIIVALLSLGYSAEETGKLYFKIIPDVMGKSGKAARSKALKHHADHIFGKDKFSTLKTCIGIVATNCDSNLPMIFKTSVKQAHGRKNTFEPGFGATIADAIRASCSAFPFFEKTVVETVNQGSPTLIDGGFVANNPSLFAIIDAKKAFRMSDENIRLLSLGTGNFPAKPNLIVETLQTLVPILPIETLQTTLATNANSDDQIRQLIFPNIKSVRINESFPDRKYSTNLLEQNLSKLRMLQTLGRESFGKYEKDIEELFI